MDSKIVSSSSFRRALFGISGLAIASGLVGYYCYYQKSRSNDLYSFKWLQKTVFTQKRVSLHKIVEAYNKVYFEQLGKYVVVVGHPGKEEHIIDIRSRICSPSSEISKYYTCYDCFQNKKDTNNLSEEEYFQQQEDMEDCVVFCEDCFDPRIHSGHRFTIKNSDISVMCGCGSSYHFKESSFCASHRGFSELKGECSKNEKVDLIQRVKSYFKSMVYILIDQIAQDCCSFKKMSSGDKEKKQISALEKISSFLTVILNQIEEVLNFDHSLIFTFSEFFQEGLNESHLKQSSELFLQAFEEVYSRETSIYEHILKRAKLMDTPTLDKLNNLLALICAADTKFVEFISLKTLENIAWYFIPKYDENGSDNGGGQTVLKQIIVLQAMQNEAFLKKLCLENGELVAKAVSLLSNLLLSSSYQYKNDFESAQLIMVLINAVFSSIEVVERFSHLDQLIEAIFNFQENVFYVSALPNDPEFSFTEEYIPNFQENNGRLVVNYSLIHQLCRLTKYAQTGLSEEKKQQVLQAFIKRYKEQIDEAFDENENYREETNLNLTYMNYSIASNIIFITIISEGTDISSRAVLNAIKRNFGFDSQDEIDEFINKIAVILSCQFISFGPYNNKSLVEELLFENDYPQEELYENYQAFLSSTICSHFLCYDFNIFASQLIYPLHKSNDKWQKYKKLANGFLNFPEYKTTNINEYNLINILLPRLFLSSVLFDSTPFINIDQQFDYILSKGKIEIESSIEETITQIVNQFIKSGKTEQKSYSQFLEQITNVIQDKNLIVKVLNKFGEFNEKNNTLNLKALKDLPELCAHEQREHYENLLFLSKEYQIQPSSNLLKRLLIKKGQFEKLFRFQQETIIGGIFDDSLLNYLKSCLSLPPQEIDSKLFKDIYLYFHVYIILWIDIIQLTQRTPSIFTPDQIDLIQDFSKEFQTEELKQLFTPLLLLDNPEQSDEITYFSKIISDFFEIQNEKN